MGPVPHLTSTIWKFSRAVRPFVRLQGEDRPTAYSANIQKTILISPTWLNFPQKSHFIQYNVI